MPPPPVSVAPAFQFSIGDAAKVVAKLPDGRQVGFNSLLEMPVKEILEKLPKWAEFQFSIGDADYLTHAGLQVAVVKVSILYWRCLAPSQLFCPQSTKPLVSILYWRCWV